MALPRVTHAKTVSMLRTFCGLSTSKVEVVEVPWNRFMRSSDGVTCKRCWSAAA
jgi:hypothetical protein